MENSGSKTPDRRAAETDDDLKAILRSLFATLAEHPDGLSPTAMRTQVGYATAFDDLSVRTASLILREGGLIGVDRYNGLILTPEGAQASAAVEDFLAWHFDNTETTEW